MLKNDLMRYDDLDKFKIISKKVLEKHIPFKQKHVKAFK